MNELTQSVSSNTMLNNVSKTKNTKILSEFEMVTHLAESLKREFHTDVFAREFTAGYGIADLVFAKSFRSKKNKLDRKPINNYYSLTIYLGIEEDSPFTMEEARRIARTNGSTLQAAINTLLDDGYIDQVSKGVYIKTRTITSEPLKLVAIEAKLRDWKQGIMQARRYKSFTDESYLALLSRYEKNVDYDLLDFHDIGLIIVDENNGEIEFKRRPIGERPSHMNSVETSVYADELFLNSFCLKTV